MITVHIVTTTRIAIKATHTGTVNTSNKVELIAAVLPVYGSPRIASAQAS
jgi:hypothetical protein